MSDTIGSQNNTVQPKRYLTISVAAELAKSPSSYIEHLCSEGYLPHAYDMSGNFLPEALPLIDILKLPNTALTSVSYVDPSAITDNENGLPSNWKLKTSRKSDIHHEDLPLFPVLKEKGLLDETKSMLLDNENENPLISIPEMEKIEAVNAEMDLIENDDKPKLDSGVVDTLLDSGKVDEEFMLEANEALAVELTNNDIPDNTSEIIFENNSLDKGVGDILNPILAGTEKVDEIKDSQKLFVKEKPRNPKQYSSVKVLPIPHVPLAEVVLSNHPLALPPSVVPFATSVPSLKSKVAAIYTQPDAMASKWLPWMRTSMWSRKMVRKATHNVEIEDNESSLPMVLSNTNNLSKSKIPSFNKKIEEKITQKSGIAIVHNSKEDIIIEPMANRINIDDGSFIYQEEETIIPKQKSIPTDFNIPKIEINDSLDAAFFKDFAKSDGSTLDRGNNSPLNQVEEKPIAYAPIPPKIEDSWDSAVFS